MFCYFHLMEINIDRRGVLRAIGAVAAVGVVAQRETPEASAGGGNITSEFTAGQTEGVTDKITVFDPDGNKVDVAQGGNIVTVVNNQEGTLDRLDFSTTGVGQVAGIVNEICSGQIQTAASKTGEIAIFLQVTDPNCLQSMRDSSRLQEVQD